MVPQRASARRAGGGTRDGQLSALWPYRFGGQGMKPEVRST